MKPIIVLAAGLVSFACESLADDLKADQRFSGTVVGFDLKGPYSNLTLTIAGPNGFHAGAAAKSGAPSIDLRGFGAVEDGSYTYHLTASTDEKVKVRTPVDNGRDARAAAEPLKAVDTSGAFRVKDGTIVKSEPASTTSKRDRQ